jgi:hypothetical protein
VRTSLQLRRGSVVWIDAAATESDRGERVTIHRDDGEKRRSP